MAEKNVPGLLVYGDPTSNGPVTYLTNYPCFGLGRRATVALGMTEGPFLFTAEPSRNLPKVRLLTTCDLEKTRQFLPMGCDRVRKLAGNRRIGLVGMANLPAGLVKDAAGLNGLEAEDISADFSVLMAAKDASALQAQRRAVGLAEEGFLVLSEQAATGKDLWEIAAYVDYRLRLAGCEDTNILLGSSAGGWMRPGYPTHVYPQPGEKLIAYIAVQCGRLWGVAGRTLSVGAADAGLDGKLKLIVAVQKKAAVSIKAGMTLSAVEATILAIGREAGLTFAIDMPLATGVGFDLHEYPQQGEDRVTKNSVLQVALTVDFEAGLTVMLIDMLHVQDHDSIWLTGRPNFES
ncbi:MAG: M24 family metallopeptidase [Deltaproteobacteria bacterium]|nr:M24 family metallopeptidase [Deltaproteobacteria bacterium]